VVETGKDGAGGEEETSASWSGFRPFTVPAALDGAMVLYRRDPLTYLGLSVLGIGPLMGVLVALEYVGNTRRLFRTSYDYDWVLLVVAALVPLLLVWKALCGGALSRAALEGLRRDGLDARKQEVLAPLSIGGLLRESMRQWREVVFAEVVRDAVLWLPYGLGALALSTVDPSMESWVRVMLIVIYWCLGLPVVLLVSSLTMMMLPKASAGPEGRRALPGTLTRSFGLGFLMGLMAMLLFLNLHLAVGLTLYLLDALFAVDVSYWSQFFALSHRLYVFVGVGLTLVLAEPLFRSAPTLIWVDAMVRRDAVDIAGRIARLGAGGGRGVASAVVHNPSASGDRERVSTVLAALVASVAFVLASLLGASGVMAQPQDGVDGQGVEVVSDDGGVTASELRAARQLLAEGDQGTWADTTELASYVRQHEADAGTEAERRYWAELNGQLQAVESSFGEEREREMRRLRVRLEGPRLFEPQQDDDGAEVQQHLDGGTVRRELDAILSEDAYRDLAAGEVERDRLELGLEGRGRRPEREDWSCDKNGFGGQAPGNDGIKAPDLKVPPGLFKVLAAVLLMSALGLVIYALVRRMVDRREEGEALSEALPTISDITTQEPGAEDVLAFGFGDWHVRAEQLAKDGQYRLAIRCLYLSLLVTLHDRSMIGYDPNLTNQEYELELRRNLRSLGVEGSAGVLASFGELTRQFEFVWYGEYEADAERYGVCARQMQAIAQAPGLSRVGADVGEGA